MRSRSRTARSRPAYRECRAARGRRARRAGAGRGRSLAPPLQRRAPFARLAGAPPTAAAAFAVRESDHVPKVIDAVIIGDFLARLDNAQRADEHPVPDVVDFGVRITGMVEVARDVAARGAVDGPAAVDLVEVKIAARLDFVGFLGGELGPHVFGDPEAFADRPCGENAKSGERAA